MYRFTGQALGGIFAASANLLSIFFAAGKFCLIKLQLINTNS